MGGKNTGDCSRLSIRQIFIERALVIAAVGAAFLSAGGSCLAQDSSQPGTTPAASTPAAVDAGRRRHADDGNADDGGHADDGNADDGSAGSTPAADGSADGSADGAPAAQPQTAGPQTTTPPQTLSQREQAQRDIKAQEKQRIMGVMPEFNTTDNPNAPPLSVGQKFDLAFHSAIDPWQFFLAGVDSGIGQAQNSFPGYGQGMQGYGKRFGAAYLDAFDGAMIGNALFPAMFHQDPRYFRRGKGKFWNRFLYAASSTVRCKGDNGKWQWNYSNVAGNLVAGAISNAYYPSTDRGLGLTFERAATVTAEGAIGAELLEFWPDIQRKFFKKHKKTDADGVRDSGGCACR